MRFPQVIWETSYQPWNQSAGCCGTSCPQLSWSACLLPWATAALLSKSRATTQTSCCPTAAGSPTGAPLQLCLSVASASSSITYSVAHPARWPGFPLWKLSSLADVTSAESLGSEIRHTQIWPQSIWVSVFAGLQRDGEDLQGVQVGAAQQRACAEEGGLQQLPRRAELGR